MRYPRVGVALVGLFLSSTYPAAAADFVIDLATHPGDLTISVAPGNLSISIVHQVPGRDYGVTAVAEAIAIPPITLPAGVTLPLGAAVDPACIPLDNGLKAITLPADEAAVAAAAATVNDLLKATTCPPANAVYRAAAAALATYSAARRVGSFTIRSGEQVKVVVQRLKADRAPEKTWTTIYSTGARGTWLTTYGFVFVPVKDELYFSAAGQKQGEFVITRQRDDAVSDIKFVPSIMFSWLAASRQLSNWSFSPAAGFGATSDSLAVLVGGTAMFNSNLAFTGGLAITQQQRLAGNYKEGQTVSENLSEDQLQVKVLKPSLFLGVTFRFGSNPFAKTNGGENSQPAGQKGD
jgi:hypothetical protein